jgi:hypothetical protein
MKTKRIEKSINILASKEAVWHVLTNLDLVSIWYEPFSAGAHAETDWQTGSKAKFIDNSGSGLLAEIKISKPGELLFMEMIGVVNNNVEDFDSEAAQAVKGGIERYVLTETDGTTELFITCDMETNYFEPMSLAWEKALDKIKELSEEVTIHN